MISKDRQDSGREKAGNGRLSPTNNAQVNKAVKLEISGMSQTAIAGNSALGERADVENRDDGNAHSDNVQNLLGRCYNGDLIASQVYLCITCGIEVEDADTLKRHELHCCSMVDTTGSINVAGTGMSGDELESFRKLVCEICRAYFSETDHLQDHKLLHLNSSNVCYLCDTYFVNRYLLAQHVVSQHSERFGVKQNEEGVHEPYTCTVCILRFSTLIGLQTHEDTHGITEKTPTCRVCSLSHSDPQAMQSHLKSSIHAEMKFQLQNLFTCIDCSTVFHSRDSYAMHMMMRAKDESCKKPNKAKVQNVDGLLETPNIVVVKEEPKDHCEDDCTESLPSTSYPQQAANQLIPVQVPGSQSRAESPSSAPATHVCPGCGMFYDSNHMASHLRTCRNVTEGQITDSWGQAANGLVFRWAINKTYSLHLPSALARKEKKCSYCEEVFFDQDDLAMHVMSDHASQMSEPDPNPSPTANARCITNNVNMSEQNGRSPWILLPSGSSLYPEVTTIPNDLLNRSDQNTEIKFQDSNIPEITEMSNDKDKSGNVTQNGLTRASTAIQSDVFVHKRRRGRSSGYLIKPESHSAMTRPKSAEVTMSSLMEEPASKRHRLDSSSSVGGSASCPLDLSLSAGQEIMGNHSKVQNINRVTFQHNVDNKENRENGQAQPHVSSSLNVARNAEDFSIQLNRTTDMPADQPGISPKQMETDLSQTFLLSSSVQERTQGNSEYSPAVECTIRGLANDSGNIEADQERNAPIADFLLENRNRMYMCKFCQIIFMDRTLYCLHMGLHNVNNPWQCNMCGKSFESVNEFHSHVLHF